MNKYLQTSRFDAWVIPGKDEYQKSLEVFEAAFANSPANVTPVWDDELEKWKIQSPYLLCTPGDILVCVRDDSTKWVQKRKDFDAKNADLLMQAQTIEKLKILVKQAFYEGLHDAPASEDISSRLIGEAEVSTEMREHASMDLMHEAWVASDTLVSLAEIAG